MWDFTVRVVCEKGCEDSSLYWRSSGFREKLERSSWETNPRSEPCVEYMTGMQRVMIAGVFASNLQVRPSCEILAKHFVSLFCHLCSTKSLPILYIPSLPTYCKECFSERKPYKLPLKVRDCYTHKHLHISLWFSSITTSPYPNPWEVESPNTYHTKFECKMRF